MYKFKPSRANVQSQCKQDKHKVRSESLHHRACLRASTPSLRTYQQHQACLSRSEQSTRQVSSVCAAVWTELCRLPPARLCINRTWRKFTLKSRKTSDQSFFCLWSINYRRKRCEFSVHWHSSAEHWSIKLQFLAVAHAKLKRNCARNSNSWN